MNTQTPSSKKVLAVFFGGISPEHEVSVITGLQLAKNCDETNYRVLPIYISKQGEWFTGSSLFDSNIYKNLTQIKNIAETVSVDLTSPGTLKITKPGFFKKIIATNVDCAILCTHGGVGEKGSLQGLLEILKIPFVGSKVLGSAVGMDKVVMKQILKTAQINVPKYCYFDTQAWNANEQEQLKECENKLNYPMFVKPANSGSSIGVTKVSDLKSLKNAIEVALSFDTKVVIEESVEGYKEINVSVIGTRHTELRASVCEQVFATGSFLNYEDKYVGDGEQSKGMVSTKREIPAKISEDAKKLIQQTAKKAYAVLNASGLARIDFLYDSQTNNYYLIEINTIPGSMSFYLWEATGVTFKDLIDILVTDAVNEFEIENELTTSFSSNILQSMESSLKGPKNSKL